MNYTREQLINICEKSFVPQTKWRNRDTADSILGVGKCLALLKAGCHFEIKEETTESTIWIQFFVRDFGWFEGSQDCKDGNQSHDYYFYLPTAKTLEEVNGGDWY